MSAPFSRIPTSPGATVPVAADATRLRVSHLVPGTVLLAGVMDEAGRIADLLVHARDGILRLDLDGVTAVTSVGLRDWIQLLARAANGGTAVELRRLCEPLVAHMNMNAAARGDAQVVSFHAPYACDACGYQESRVIEVSAHLGRLRQGVAPAAACPACSADLVFDEFADRYFGFLAPVLAAGSGPILAQGTDPGP